MTEAYLISLAQNSLTVALMLAGPVLIVSLVIGSLVSLIQAATSINEATMTFVPKIIAIVVVLVVLGGWMGQNIISYTTGIFNDLPNLVK